MASISLCAIFKNDLEFVEEFVEQYKNFVDQWVLIDTGSTDGSDQKFRELLSGVPILKFRWVNDFSAARNYALEKANQEWIFFPDLDERLRTNDVLNLKDSLENLSSKVGGLIMDCINTTNYDWKLNPVSIQSLHKVIRVFRNHESIRFENKVHETIEPSIEAAGLNLIQSKMRVYHLGYAGTKYIEKIKRNEKIINDCFKDYSTNNVAPPPYLIFYYCQHNWSGAEKILELLLLGLSHSSGKLRNFFLEGCLTWHQAFGDLNEMRKYFLELSRNSPDCVILTLKEAREAFVRKNIGNAIDLYHRAYSNSHLEGFIQVFRPEILMNLGFLYACKNEFPNAMKYWLEYVELFGQDHNIFWQLAKLYHLTNQDQNLEELLSNPPQDISKSSEQASTELKQVIVAFEKKSKLNFDALKESLKKNLVKSKL